MDIFDPVKFRKLQEQVAELEKAGVFKEIARGKKAMFDAYVEVGFTREEALKLVISECDRQSETS